LGIGLAAYLRRTRELRHMDTGELLRKYKNATKETGTLGDMRSAEEREKEKEDTKTAADISEICVSRVHDLCDYLHGAYHDQARHLLSVTLSRVESKYEKAQSQARTAQIAFLKKALDKKMSKEELEGAKGERDARAITGPLREIPIDENGHNSVYGHVATWDVRRVTDMSDAFLTDGNVRSRELMDTINRSLEDLTLWDTRNVKTMRQMFF
jgi:hypothetical protein